MPANAPSSLLVHEARHLLRESSRGAQADRRRVDFVEAVVNRARGEHCSERRQRGGVTDVDGASLPVASPIRRPSSHVLGTAGGGSSSPSICSSSASNSRSGRKRASVSTNAPARSDEA